ncbi:cytochrome P450 [Phlebopus sp. FC_14]|nr:cytochrome P450 [Phlebopus sp. FC_14]
MVMNAAVRSHWIITGITVFILKLAIDKVLSLRKAFARISKYPGRRLMWIDPFHPLALIVAPFFPPPGSIGYYGAKLTFYKEFGNTIFASVRFLTARPYFWVADAEAMKLVASDRHTFRKDVRAYEPLNIYGPNLVSTEMSDWKRHRTVAMPAFSEANVAMVWQETLRIVNQWFEQLDNQASSSKIKDLTVDLTAPMAQATLLIISGAGFGRRVSWVTDSSAEPPSGCQLTFRSAVMTAVQNVLSRALIPSWFTTLSAFVKVPYVSSHALETQLAFEDLQRHMLEIVSSARSDVASNKPRGDSDAALLRNLVVANMSQDGDYKRLSDGELLSNIFAFLLAGHETSAHTLSFAFILLALYPEAQQKLYKEAVSVWPGTTPTTELPTTYKEDFGKLEYTLAFFRETLRLFPSEPRLAKDVHNDTVLPAVSFTTESKRDPMVAGETSMVIVPAGSVIIMDIWALHVNPLYWGDDVEEFKPERFIDKGSYRWPRHAYMPFSAGARSCIGQRFATTESLLILANVVRRYEVLVPDDLASKTRKQQEEALLKWTTGVTLTPTNARVKLRRRV